MARGRRLITIVTAIWLSSQVAAIAGAPVALWLPGTNAQTVECKCTHGKEQACPMHHTRSAKSTDCVMERSDGDEAMLLTLLFTAAGLTPESTPFTVVMPAARYVRLAAPGRYQSARIAPDPPPPRA